MKFLFVIGTRPEAIKMAPLIKGFKAHPGFQVKVCVTAQHRQMLDQVLSFFDIKPDFDLDLMKPDQTLIQLAASALGGLHTVLAADKPDVILVQGDTTTAFVGALAGYYSNIKVAHIEAGLRSGNLRSPYPEEGNRLLVGRITDYHFPPTQKAADNLSREGYSGKIETVGNSVIDALFLGLDLIDSHYPNIDKDFSYLKAGKRVILITSHRRESFGDPFRNICEAIRTIATDYPDVELVYPVHLNPNIRKPVNEMLSGIPNVHLVEPLDYPHLIWLMRQSYFVLTDSGGIQEEAPSLGKPVLVMRDVTEREEGIEAGTALLVGTQKEVILRHARQLLDSPEAYQRMAKAVNPYGDGQTTARIVKFFEKETSVS